ncbi:hypothetical protein FN846DRAFT_909901 [Sphaerosporella brunnea]|uniref:Uncharacterized protein n=1 Tax=Sphaerosporella brunnea TaxID=1250544 RepID=A0A5J5EPS7_9PEZI|nr:hypothetical protein FN846DRAFT_909901 [Sphaerosporella brunnea]
MDPLQPPSRRPRAITIYKDSLELQNNQITAAVIPSGLCQRNGNVMPLTQGPKKPVPDISSFISDGDENIGACPPSGRKARLVDRSPEPPKPGFGNEPPPKPLQRNRRRKAQNGTGLKRAATITGAISGRQRDPKAAGKKQYAPQNSSKVSRALASPDWRARPTDPAVSQTIAGNGTSNDAASCLPGRVVGSDTTATGMAVPIDKEAIRGVVKDVADEHPILEERMITSDSFKPEEVAGTAVDPQPSTQSHNRTARNETGVAAIADAPNQQARDTSVSAWMDDMDRYPRRSTAIEGEMRRVPTLRRENAIVGQEWFPDHTSVDTAITNSMPPPSPGPQHLGSMQEVGHLSSDRLPTTITFELPTTSNEMLEEREHQISNRVQFAEDHSEAPAPSEAEHWKEEEEEKASGWIASLDDSTVFDHSEQAKEASTEVSDAQNSPQSLGSSNKFNIYSSNATKLSPRSRIPIPRKGSAASVRRYTPARRLSTVSPSPQPKPTSGGGDLGGGHMSPSRTKLSPLGSPSLIVAPPLPDSLDMGVTAGVARIAILEVDGDTKKADPKLLDRRRHRQSSIPIPERCSSDRHKLSCPHCRIKEDIPRVKITPPAPAEKLVVKKTRAFKEELVGGRHTAARALARRVSSELLAARKFEAEREAAEAQRLAGKGAKRNSLGPKGYRNSGIPSRLVDTRPALLRLSDEAVENHPAVIYERKVLYAEEDKEPFPPLPLLSNAPEFATWEDSVKSYLLNAVTTEQITLEMLSWDHIVDCYAAACHESRSLFEHRLQHAMRVCGDQYVEGFYEQVEKRPELSPSW